MKKLWSIWICCLLLFAGGVPLHAQKLAENDELLQLLRQEMKQQFDSLQHTSYPPYFLAYRINETTDHYVSANFGHIYENNSTKNVFLTIEIRVGNPLIDNYHSSIQKSREIKQIPLPIEENIAHIQKILQKETRLAYADAVLEFIDNQSDIRLKTQKRLPDLSFSPQKTVAHYEPRILDNHWQEEEWLQTLRYCTADAEMLPDVTESSANLHYKMNRQYMVNSENSYVVENHIGTYLSLFLEGIAADNTPDHIEFQYFTELPEQMPDGDALLSEMLRMETKLYAKLDAPKAKATLCPVWLSPQAAAVLAHHLFGHEMGENESSVFDGFIAQTVLPFDFSVISDPTLPQRAGEYWSGSYKFDDEGFGAERVTLIENGDLKNRLAARTQQPEAFQPNGHARGKLKLPAARQSNLILSTNKPLNDNQLLDLFRREIKNQHLEYGIFVLESDFYCDTNHQTITIYPTVCYKVFADGRADEVVRDVKISGAARQWLENLMVGGNQTASVALTCHSLGEDLPTHSCAPALIFRRLEVKPHSPSPRPRMVAHLYTNAEQYDYVRDLFKKVVDDELEIDEVSLSVKDVNPPYYQDYLMTDVRLFAVEASEESVFYAKEKTVRQLVPRVLLGSDVMNNDNIHGSEVTPPVSYPVTEDVSYPAFARDFRKATEAEYLKAVSQWELKRALLQLSDKKNLMDRSKSVVTQSFHEQSMSCPSLNNLEHLAREISSELSHYDFLSQSGVNIYVMMGDVYFQNSEKTGYIRPVSIVAMQIYGATIVTDGTEYRDGKTIFWSSTDSLFASQKIHNEINKLVSHLYALKSATKQQQTYVGPVLVEGEAVGQLLASALLEEAPNLLAYREPLVNSSNGETIGCQILENLKDQIVTSNKISITANKTGDQFDKVVFCSHEKTDAEGVETMETEIIRHGELINLMGNRTPTKSMDYSNGFQQLAIQKEVFFATRGASRLDFEFRTTASHAKLKQMLVKEAKKQGCQYAYIIRQLQDEDMDNIMGRNSSEGVKILQLYRLDVRTGKETAVVGGVMPALRFPMLEKIQCASDAQEAYPVFSKVRGAEGSRDFPFAGVPTCIIAPNALFFSNLSIGN